MPGGRRLTGTAGGPIDLASATATRLAAGLAAGEVSSTELLEATLARIERLNPALGAVVALDAERARQRARAADDAQARGAPLGPLHGLPMTVKDSLETEGLVTACGAGELAGHVPARDAEVVARIRAAGAVVVGKTNVPRYAGDFQTYNEVYGLTRNPWDPERTPGGSSGGAAVAVATGMSTLEVGSDVAGSIRAPAHYCGVCGHMPTWSAVPGRGHVPPAPGSLATAPFGVIGPLARDVDDLELLLDVLVGDDLAGVPGARLPEAPPATRSVAGCRVGLWLDHPLARTDREARAVLSRLADRLADEGAVLLDRLKPPRPFWELQEVSLRVLFATLSATFDDEEYAELAALARRAGEDADDPRMPMALAVTVPYRDWLALEEQRARLEAAWLGLFDDVDVLLAPVTPLPAFPHDIERPPVERELLVNGRAVPYFNHTVWTGLANLARLPATAVPAGRTEAGLPVGAQVVGPRWADRGTLAFARAVERLGGGFVPPPVALTAPEPPASSAR